MNDWSIFKDYQKFLDGTQEREIHIFGWATAMLVTEVGGKNQHQDVTNIIIAKNFRISAKSLSRTDPTFCTK